MTIPADWQDLDTPNQIFPATHLVSYTVSESPDVSPACRAFIVDVDGTLVVDAKETGTEITIQVLAGIVYPISITKIYSSSSGPTTVVTLN